ncbi:magnesium chelatase, subunit ChlI family protein [Lysobacter gummosus]|nr:magnesium chelatase, subunit ChlI family protein [Lysobacter gummosus]
MNPCPCGWAGDSSGRCHCATDAIRRYRARISGPLLDRIDLHIDVPRLPPQALRPDQPGGESSADIRARVTLARERQFARSGKTNAQLDQAGTAAICRLSERDQGLLERAVDALQLSARSMHRIQRVARTIADLAGSEAITTAHLTEAIGYRRNDAATSGAR